MKPRLLLFCWLLLSLHGCAIVHPCLEGGDVQFGSTIQGTRQCNQQKNKEGAYVNHGRYVQWYPHGAVAVEGAFKNGKKDGLWYQYDDTGKKLKEAFFVDGVETPRDGEKMPTSDKGEQK